MSNPHLPHWGDADVTWGGSWTWPTVAELQAGPSIPPNTKPKRNRNRTLITMNQDYLPRSYKNLLAWCIQQETELTTQLATDMDMPTSDRTTFLAAVAILKAACAEIVELMDTLEEKTANFPVISDQQVPIIRAIIKSMRPRPGCTPGIVAQLDWEGASHNVDPNDMRPLLEVEAQRGRVKISGRKPGFDAVNIYFRRKGDVQWKLIAPQRLRFPFFDESPLAVANTPEVREYMAIGVVKDEEVGQMSEIKEVVYAG